MLTVDCKVHGAAVRSISSGSGRRRCAKCAGAAVTKRRRKVKRMAVEYKGGRCVRCGYNKSMAALDFHHTDPSQKDFTISKSGHCQSWEKVRLELDKCVLVCRNCHAEIHEELLMNGLED